MPQSEFLVAGHLDGSEEIIARLVTASNLAQAKTALKNELREAYEPQMSDLWNGNDDDRREVHITYAQALSSIQRLDATEVGSVGLDNENNKPVGA